MITFWLFVANCVANIIKISEGMNKCATFYCGMLGECGISVHLL